MHVRSSSLLPSLSGTASTHFRPMVMVSACVPAGGGPLRGTQVRTVRGRSSGSVRRSLRDQSAIDRDPPRASDATLFETDFMLCSVSASKATVSTRRPLISSEPLKYRSNTTSLPPRAITTACTLAFEAHEAIGHPAAQRTRDPMCLLVSSAEATGHPSSRAAGTPQPSGGAACTGIAVSGARAAPPRSELNRRCLIRSSVHTSLQARRVSPTV